MAKDSIGERKFEVAGEQVFHSYREGNQNKSGLYLKTPHEESSTQSGYGDVNQEFRSYQLLSKYLCMPRVRILKDKKGEKVLVIQKIFGEPIGDLFLKDPKKALSCSLKYIEDQNKMWKSSVRPMDENNLSANKKSRRETSASNMENFLTFKDTEEFLTAEVVSVNGVEYRNLKEKLATILETIKSNQDPVMVMGNGDDHLHNILHDGQDKDDNYYVIDPMLAGNYSPVISYANFGLYLLLYKYNFTTKTKRSQNKIEVDYALEKDFSSSIPYVITALKEIEKNLASLSDQPFLVKEHIIAKLLTFVQKLNNRKNFSHTEKNIPAYLALAIELINDKYRMISDLYENLR